MIIMTKGIVKIKKNRAFVEQQNGEVEVASGQYVYLKVENCSWIPVVVRYSARRKKWYFKYLEETGLRAEGAAEGVAGKGRFTYV